MFSYSTDGCRPVAVPAAGRFGWITEPATRTVELQWLDAGGYRLIGVFQGKSILPSEVVGKLPVRVEQFFA